MTALLAARPGVAAAGDLRALLDGVREVAAEGLPPGALAVFGEQAFVVMTGRDEDGRQPIFAAARYGRGRVFAGGDPGLFGPEALTHPGTVRLLENAVAWTGGKPRGQLRVAVVQQEWLWPSIQRSGFRVDAIGPHTMMKRLDLLDVVCTPAGLFTGPNGDVRVPALLAFVRRGGGLIVTANGPFWKRVSPDRDLAREFGGNRLFIPMGIAFTENEIWTPGIRSYAPDGHDLTLCHATLATDALLSHVTGRARLKDDSLRQAIHTVTRAYAALPQNDSGFGVRVRMLLARYAGPALPTVRTPVPLDQPFARLKIAFQASAMRRRPPDRQPAHPSARDFPGSVTARAPRVSRTMTVDARAPVWNSTGLYAAPGEVITVTIPAAVARTGLTVRIGCHTDTLWQSDSWRRFPEIAAQARLEAPRTRLASPFGGLVAIEGMQDAHLFAGHEELLPGRVPVTIAGGVEAPYFIRGRTSLAEWRATIRKRPTPWAELVGQKVILSVPSAVVRDLEDPEALLALWDAAANAAADLAREKAVRRDPERLVVDRQLAGDAMHSGYPIMLLEHVAGLLVSRERMLANVDDSIWGVFRQLGHRFRPPNVTFEGASDVTDRLFALYMMEKALGVPAARNPRVANENVREAVSRYFAGGARFDEWRRQPDVALTMYLQLQQTFGWDAFQRVFAQYTQASPLEWPRDAAEKRDLWLVRFSRVVERNLGPFFTAWGVPTSEAARASVAHFPSWMPPESAP